MEHNQMREVFLKVLHKAFKGYFSPWGRVFIKDYFKNTTPTRLSSKEHNAKVILVKNFLIDSLSAETLLVFYKVTILNSLR